MFLVPSLLKKEVSLSLRWGNVKGPKYLYIGDAYPNLNSSFTI